MMEIIAVCFMICASFSAGMNGDPAKSQDCLASQTILRDGQSIWIEKEVNEFLYKNGANPFDARLGLNRVRQGVGVLRDVFIADYEKPC